MSTQSINNRKYPKGEIFFALHRFRNDKPLSKKYICFTRVDDHLEFEGKILVALEEKDNVLAKIFFQEGFSCMTQAIDYVSSKYCGMSRAYIGKFYKSLVKEPAVTALETIKEEVEPVVEVKPVEKHQVYRVGSIVQHKGKSYVVSRERGAWHSIVSNDNKKRPIQGERFRIKSGHTV